MFDDLQSRTKNGDACASSRAKKARNQENARRAHYTILRIGNKATLTEDERVELNGRLVELRSALEKLGEVF